MRTLLLVAHVAAVILFIGPATIATSLFPRHALAESARVARLLNRISRVYGTCSLTVPAVGLALASRGDYLNHGWVQWSLALFAGGLALLFGAIFPGQRRMLAAIDSAEAAPASTRTILRVASGLYAVAWLAMLWLMVAKPE